MNNEWYEKGELPPVGIECEVDIGGEGFGWGQIVHHSGSASWIVTKSEDKIIRNDLARFRPIKTERERTIGAALKVLGGNPELYNYTNHKAQLSKLYDAGLLRLPGLPSRGE